MHFRYFGSGTVMIPWAIISTVNGDIRLGIALFVLYVIILQNVFETMIDNGIVKTLLDRK